MTPDEVIEKVLQAYEPVEGGPKLVPVRTCWIDKTDSTYECCGLGAIVAREKSADWLAANWDRGEVEAGVQRTLGLSGTQIRAFVFGFDVESTYTDEELQSLLGRRITTGRYGSFDEFSRWFRAGEAAAAKVAAKFGLLYRPSGDY